MNRRLLVTCWLAVTLLLALLHFAPASAQPAVTIQKTVDGAVIFTATLLTAVTATSDGEWVPLEGLYPFTVHVDGITTATAQLRVSNSPTAPVNTDNEVQYLADITAEGAWAVEIPFRWVKVRISAYTSGTINAYLFGKTP